MKNIVTGICFVVLFILVVVAAAMRNKEKISRAYGLDKKTETTITTDTPSAVMKPKKITTKEGGPKLENVDTLIHK